MPTGVLSKRDVMSRFVGRRESRSSAFSYVCARAHGVSLLDILQTVIFGFSCTPRRGICGRRVVASSQALAASWNMDRLLEVSVVHSPPKTVTGQSDRHDAIGQQTAVPHHYTARQCVS